VERVLDRHVPCPVRLGLAETYLRQPGPVAQPLGQLLRLGRQGPQLLTSPRLDLTHPQLEIGVQHERQITVITLTLDRLHGGGVERRRRGVSGGRDGLLTGCIEVSGGLRPLLATKRVMGEELGGLATTVARQLLQRLHRPRVQPPPPLLEEPCIGHLVSQRVLKSVLQCREGSGLVQEFGSLQIREVVSECLLGDLRNGLKNRIQDVLADDRSGLEEIFLLGREPIDPGREHRLNCHRDLGGVNRTGRAVGSTRPDESAGFGERSHALLQEEGIALRARDQYALERIEAGVGPEQRAEEL
jgi:hypothetical protein